MWSQELLLTHLNPAYLCQKVTSDIIFAVIDYNSDELGEPLIRPLLMDKDDLLRLYNKHDFCTGYVPLVITRKYWMNEYKENRLY